MELAICVAGGGLGLALGSVSAGVQHRLYRNPAYRDHPARGRRLLVMRFLLAVACAVVVGLALRPDHYDLLPALVTAAFGIVLVVIASTDFERRIIPDRLSLPGIVLALALSWVWPDRSVGEVLLGAGIAFAAGAALFLLGAAAGNALGMGDAKLIVLLGAIVGWPGVMYALFLGIVAAGIPAIALLLAGRRRTFYSYGPYLVLGGLIVMLWPERFL